ncbi:MAG: hypothetical protein IJB48_02915 [Clostridia bacterium]|nr:hypothetical protein [Clostridia bacterium]
MAEDNNQLIQSLMGMLGDNPQEKINAVLKSLTGDESGESSVDLEKLGETLASPSEEEQKDSTQNTGTPDLSGLLKIQGLLSQLGGTSDERASLLLSLKPFLSESRKPHVDRALNLLKLTKLAEAAKGMDLLKDFKL